MSTSNLRCEYTVEAKCDDCGEDIEEVRYYDKDNNPVHITTCTIGHYYLDGSVSCDACHDGNR